MFGQLFYNLLKFIWNQLEVEWVFFDWDSQVKNLCLYRGNTGTEIAEYGLPTFWNNFCLKFGEKDHSMTMYHDVKDLSADDLKPSCHDGVNLKTRTVASSKSDSTASCK